LSLLTDFRLAARRLYRQPGYSCLAVLILALGLGTTTAMFSLVRSAVSRPLPYPEPERLVRIQVGVGPAATGSYYFQPFVFAHLRQHNDVLSGMAAVNFRQLGLGHPGQPPEPVGSLSVTADFFGLMAMPPALGRLFLPDEDQPDRSRVVVLSDRLWRQRFGADPRIVGRSLVLGDQPVTVVGVMPAAFSDPLHRWTRAELWRPMALSPADLQPDATRSLEVWGRLRPGLTRPAAAAQLTAIAARLGDGQKRTVLVRPLGNKSGLKEEIQVGVWLALGLAVFVLLIACTNLAGMQLARLAGRGHEQATRRALGATRWRLVREAMVENLLVSLVGGALGVILAFWCADLVGSRLILDDGPQTTIGVPVQIDVRVLLFALASAVLSAAIVGIAPACLGERAALFETLRRGGQGTTARPRPQLGQSLVVAQMAMALVLLMGGGLFLRGLQRLRHESPGWRMDGLMTGRLKLQGPRYADRGARVAFLDRLEPRLRAIPGVSSIATSEWVPVSGDQRLRIAAEGLPAPPSPRSAYVDPVSSDYFRVLGIALRQGRPFGPDDAPGGLPVIVINQRMADELWPAGSPLGKRIALAVDDPSVPAPFAVWRTIVGVVSDIRFPGQLDYQKTRLQVYSPIRQMVPRDITISLRTQGAPEASLGALRAAVADLDPSLVVHDASTIRGLMDQELANFSLTGWVMFALAVLGLLVAALGVYGLFSGFVVQRTREIGVRVALGARRGQVVGLVLRKGVRLAFAGALVGMLGVGLVVPALRAVAYELPAHEPMAVLLLAAALVAVALLACWLPARRAAALDPMVALRHE
jgi:putative ABC transport system permease protein